MRQLEQPAPDRVPRLTPLRLTLLTVASLIAPVVEATQELRRGNLDLLVIIAASVVLFGLVVLRMAGLVRQQERSVARERTLSAAGASLVAATGREEIYRAALMAVRGLFDDAAAARLCLVEEGRLSVVAAEGGLELAGDTWPIGPRRPPSCWPRPPPASPRRRRCARTFASGPSTITPTSWASASAATPAACSSSAARRRPRARCAAPSRARCGRWPRRSRWPSRARR